MALVKDMSGQKIKNLTVIKYLGGSQWECKCDCGDIHIMDSRVLRNQRFAYCDKLVFERFKKDGTYGELKIIEVNNVSSILCVCSCGNIIETTERALNSGKSSCGHEKIDDMLGSIYGSWEVIGFTPPYYCKCIDINTGTQRDVNMYDLLSGKSKSSKNELVDLTDKYFGNWRVIRYVGNQLWECQCQCDKHTIKNVDGQSLRTGKSLSCGCNHYKNQLNTMLDKYGDSNKNKSADNRELWQIMAMQYKECMEHVINRYEHKPTSSELSSKLNVSKSRLLKKIKSFGLQDKINLKPSSSIYEEQLYEVVNKYSNYVVRNCRTVVDGYEIDIYIPEKKLAIEFNGTYWHSDIFKDKYYHQQKTIACAKKGIRLIHIFEYEWLESDKRIKIESMLARALSQPISKIGARKTDISEITYNDANNFLNKYHLQDGVASNIYIGCYYNNNLIGVITLGKPRFNSNYEYEIHRLCWSDNVIVMGGTEKMINYFINKYNPQSIITYSDISKFTGNSYTRAGFKPIQPNPITEPNYVWVRTSDNEVLTRYQTQKHKLIEAGIGNENQTETDIMEDAGFIRIYDSGNIRLEWSEHNGS